MFCRLCWKNCKCVCRGWWCSQCGQSNPQVEYTNKVIDLWTDKKVIIDNLDLLKTGQRLRIDPYFIWDKLTNGVEFPEDMLEAIENNKQLPATTTPKVLIKSFTVTENPNEFCDFGGDKSPWAKCIYCWSISRYIKWKQCPAFKWNKKEDVQQL